MNQGIKVPFIECQPYLTTVFLYAHDWLDDKKTTGIMPIQYFEVSFKNVDNILR
jgi:hypothetical protein